LRTLLGMISFGRVVMVWGYEGEAYLKCNIAILRWTILLQRFGQLFEWFFGILIDWRFTNM